MLAIVGVFLWAVIRPPAPVTTGIENAGGPPVAGEKRIAGAAGSWTLYAWAVPGADRAVTVTVSARDLAERPIASSAPPTAVLRMLDMAMGAERIVLAQEGPGFWPPRPPANVDLICVKCAFPDQGILAAGYAE